MLKLLSALKNAIPKRLLITTQRRVGILIFPGTIIIVLKLFPLARITMFRFIPPVRVYSEERLNARARFPIITESNNFPNETFITSPIGERDREELHLIVRRIFSLNYYALAREIRSAPALGIPHKKRERGSQGAAQNFKPKLRAQASYFTLTR